SRVGPAAQTFAAVRCLACKTGETFASVRVIGDKACRPPRTVKRHLALLCKHKWLQRKGRQKRRTPTYVVAQWYLNRNDEMKYALLPRWAAALLPTWAERAVFALVVSR